MTASLPLLDEFNRFFWTRGADGRLRVQRCGDCQAWLHPPGPVCPHCQSRRLAPQEVSGLATVEAVTVNHQVWTPDLQVPYAIAWVTLDGVPGVRLTTRIVGVPAERVAIGHRVKVCFVERDEVFLPYFEPV